MLPRNTLLQNRYRIIGTLGQGGMGYVYDAIDESVLAQVAIKENLADSTEKRKSFAHEAKLLANLRHDALPQVMHQFIEGNRQFLVMEYIKGDNLLELLEKYQRVSLRQRAFRYEVVLQWADRLLSALEYLHSLPEPVIHRDIKPSNIKLTGEGKIYLLDFGLAKGVAGQMTTVKVGEGVQSIYGYSERYAPLEQLTNAGTDARSDIYSLGATLYHLLTGTPPVTAADRHRALDVGEADPLRPAHRVNAAVPLSVSRVIGRAMAMSRRDRIPSAGEMRRELQEAQQIIEAGLDNDPPVTNRPSPILEPIVPVEPTAPAPGPTTASPTSEQKASPSDTESGPSPVMISETPSTITGEPPMAAPLEDNFSVTDKEKTGAPQRRSDAESVLPASSTLETGDGEESIRAAQPNVGGGEQGEQLPPELNEAPLVDGNQVEAGKEVAGRKTPQSDTWREKVEQQKLFMQQSAQALKDRTLNSYQWKSVGASESERPDQPRRPLIILAIFTLLIISIIGVGIVLIVSNLNRRPENVNTTMTPTPTYSPSIAGPSPTTGDKGPAPPAFPYSSQPRSTQVLKGQEGIAWAVRASPDGNLLASASADHTVRLWDARSKVLTKTLRHEADVYSIAFSPDSKTIASASEDRTIKLWDTQSGELKKTLADNSDVIYFVVFSPDGKLLASVGKDSKVRLWDWQSSQEPRRFEGHSGAVFTAAFSPDGRILASAGEDKTIRLWDVQNGKPSPPPLAGHTNVIFSLAFSHDKRFLVSGGKDQRIKVWRTDGWQEETTLRQGRDGQQDWVTALAFSPDDKALASASTKGTVSLWDTQQWQIGRTLKDSDFMVDSLSFSPDGRTLITGGHNKKVKLSQW